MGACGRRATAHTAGPAPHAVLFTDGESDPPCFLKIRPVSVRAIIGFAWEDPRRKDLLLKEEEIDRSPHPHE